MALCPGKEIDMKKARLLKVLPAKRRIVTLVSNISLADMRRLTGTADMLAADYGVFDDYLVRALRPRHELTVERELSRFRLGDHSAIAGETILFGANSTGQAASCPLTEDQVYEVVEWLPSLAEVGAQAIAPWSTDEAAAIAEELGDGQD